MKNPELISPAGTLEKLKTAFEFGADAVYAGVPDFSLRARINEFTYAKMKTGVKYAHIRGKKVYATLNIYAHNKHLKKAEVAIKKYFDMGVDALIVSDPGILAVIKRVAPKMEIHLSTQANCTNWQAAKFWQNQGVKRIVLAREVSLKEIKEIHKKAPNLELEYFVHGAMCMSYSGRCILSKWLSNRSANLGECSQPCRWEYELSKDPPLYPLVKGGIQRNIAVKEKDGEILAVEQNKNGTYIFNSRDLCLIEHLDKLYKAGISSFKIEGRTKSAYYAGAIAKLYRNAIDNNLKAPKGWKEEIKKFANRGYTTGFLFGEEKCEHSFFASHEKCSWQFVGEVLIPPPLRRGLGGGFLLLKKDKLKKGIYIKIHNALYCGNEIEFVIPRGKNIKMKIKEMYDAETGKELQEAHGGQGQTVIIYTDKHIPSGSLVRRMVKG